MKELNLYYFARVYLSLFLEDYLNDFSHDKDEKELINNLLERLNYEASFKMSFSKDEIKLLINSVKHALETRQFVPEFIMAS